MQDWLTKYIILIPVKVANAQEVVRALTEKVIANLGPPRVIITDQGSHFQNRLLEEFAIMFKIEKYCTSAYHPQSNGGIERMHHTLTEYIKQFVSEIEKWDEVISLCQHAYNTTVHDATGFTPHELIFGEKARTLLSFSPSDKLTNFGDYLSEVKNNISQLQTLAAMNLINQNIDLNIITTEK